LTKTATAAREATAREATAVNFQKRRMFLYVIKFCSTIFYTKFYVFSKIWSEKRAFQWCII
jgi:hypothetical protein